MTFIGAHVSCSRSNDTAIVEALACLRTPEVVKSKISQVFPHPFTNINREHEMLATQCAKLKKFKGTLSKTKKEVQRKIRFVSNAEMSMHSALMISTRAPRTNDQRAVHRQSANYHPSIWGDYFITHANVNLDMHIWQQEAEELKEIVRNMLTVAAKLPEKLKMIDEIQRLGIAYHFEAELEEELAKIFNTYQKGNDGGDGDLQTTALQFRLLRQHGYNVSCDIFKKFKDDEGNFNDTLAEDVEGMLSLFEATHLKVHGEDILDEALDFTVANLNSLATHLSFLLAKKIQHALKQPIRKCPPRLQAREFISYYQESESHNEVLLKFAKLDFNILQKLHQKELGIITLWWKHLDFKRKLPFARDKIVECYLWILEVHFEPQYALARKFATKIIAIASIIDDIYDVYGTKDELQLFTRAVERWDIGVINELPDYMKFCYRALLDTFAEMEEEMPNKERSYRLEYAKEAVKTLVKAYFEETKWLNKEDTPTMEEYVKVALVSSGYPMMEITSLVGMGDDVTKKDLDWLCNKPKIVHASSIICRFMDDIVSHKAEQEREHIPSAVECYMKQYGVSEQQACKQLNKHVDDAWRDINEAYLRPLSTSISVLTCILNYCRVMDAFYKDEDGYTNSATKLMDYIASLLVNPVEI